MIVSKFRPIRSKRTRYITSRRCPLQATESKMPDLVALCSLSANNTGLTYLFCTFAWTTRPPLSDDRGKDVRSTGGRPIWPSEHPLVSVSLVVLCSLSVKNKELIPLFCRFAMRNTRRRTLSLSCSNFIPFGRKEPEISSRKDA